MTHDSTPHPANDAIDPEEFKRFATWFRDSVGETKGDVLGKVAEDMVDGYALAALCDLELSGALRSVRGEVVDADDAPWIDLEALREYVKRGEGNSIAYRVLLGSLLEMVNDGLVLAKVLPASRYKGEYMGADIGFLVNWPHFLDDWARAVRKYFRPDGHVYVLGAPDFYKIGRAKNVDDRLKQLAIQLPWKVEVAHTIPCEDYAAAERELHRRYADRRANGEWFMLTPQDVEWIKGIERMRGESIER